MSFGSKCKFKGTSLNSSEIKMNTNQKEKILAQYGADAELLAEFEQSSLYGKSFDYSKTVLNPPNSVSEEKMIAYLSRIQRGGFIQPFGCMVVMEEHTFRIIGYSENCFQMLGLESDIGPEHFVSLIGVNVTTLFTPLSGSSLVKVLASRENSRLNPIWVHAKITGKPFYAMLHRIDVGVVIDLEPACSSGPALSQSGTFQSQKLAFSAISRLQSCRCEDISLLYDTVVEEVQKLTGYDRVMIYKFHEDDHGEVVSEIRRSDLEPYLGLHYPAIDIPQAARFLFKQNRVRLISDCHANPVTVIQSQELKQPICLVNSTLRSPHDCHKQYLANMGTIASLVIAIIINENDTTRLWGLLACHHTSPHHVSFPVRHACEFVVQTFGLQLYMDIQLASQMIEKRILKTQTLLCDMLLCDGPFGIVTQSPSIMDLVKCDGAALYYDENCWLLGITPTKLQVKDIAEWLLRNYGDSTGLATESLADAGYPGATLLGDAVCGMTSAIISPRHILFWFRSHTAKEIKWGGAKHHPTDKDDGGKMNPRTSFKVFLEVVKSKSLPWEISEINAIRSLQLIMRDSFKDTDNAGPKTLDDVEKSDAPIVGMHEISSVAFEMVKLIETAIVPIFGVDSNGRINGWNVRIAELTGLQASKAMGKSLVNEVVDADSRETATNILRRALQGQDITSEKVVLNKFVKLEGDYKAIMQSLNPPIPPIFASDENACCSEWNATMERLTGWKRDEVIGKMLLGEIFGTFCRLKGQDTLTDFMILLYRGISGQQDSEKSPFGFYDRNGEFIEAYITTNKRTDASGDIIGCFCILQIVTVDTNQPSQGHKSNLREEISESKELAYILQGIKKPLNGIRFTHKLLENTDISENQKQLLDTSEACEKQILTVIEDTYLHSINEGTWQLNMEEFLLGNILRVVVSQVMELIKGNDVKLFHEIPDEIQTLPFYGDQIRLQVVLSDILYNVVSHTPSPNGWIEIKISPGLKIMQDGNEFIRLMFRMTHSGEGLPSAVLHDMFYGDNQWTTQEDERGKQLNIHL
ncbi:hypothetical protein TSUD_10410 [Trifolium subterraneum]|nr:hypothetical protein TSUD_10410 [Trifolium subterraneum]